MKRYKPSKGHSLSKGYVIIVKTTINNPNGGYRTTKTILDNKAWKLFNTAYIRIYGIVDNKCKKHNYILVYNNLNNDRTKRSHSDIDICIMRDNYNVVKTYTIKPIQIGL